MSAWRRIMDSTCATVCLDTPARIANRSSIKFANLKNTNGLVNFFWEPRGNRRGGFKARSSSDYVKFVPKTLLLF